MPLVTERVLAARKHRPDVLVKLFVMARARKNGSEPAARRVLMVLRSKVQSGEIRGKQVKELYTRFQKHLTTLRKNEKSPIRLDALLLAAALGDREAVPGVRELAETAGRLEKDRVQALETLIALRDTDVLERAARMLTDTKTLSAKGRVKVLNL